LKKIVDVLRDAPDHWSGDSFPVRTVFVYDRHGQQLSPFLLLDCAGPYHFEAAARPRGVGPKPHRGFEVATIVYDGKVSHQDSTGYRGTIGPGDVQWMTAGAGALVHEVYSAESIKTGGLFRMVQVWVNLPAGLKLTPPKYQSIKTNEMPVIELKGGVGRVRVIAGSLDSEVGPAETFTPINVWDLVMKEETRLVIEAPEDHTAVVVVLSGALLFEAAIEVHDAEAVLLSRSGNGALLTSTAPTNALVLTGAPIDEPMVGRGPFVMNTEAELRQAFKDFASGRLGATKLPLQSDTKDRARHWPASNLISGYAPSGGRP
jgi:quercetin 2,3-dioxygenase